MKSPDTHGEEPLSIFTLIVISLEMLAIVAIVCYACTETANGEYSATWFGEHTMELRGSRWK
jgi:hypothetical protein